MILTTKGRYAVMAMVDVCLAAEDGAPVRLANIAERQEIDQGYLEQIFAKLKKNNLVISTRGPGGGYSLARAPEEISVLEIMSAVEEEIKMTRCSGKGRGCMKDNAFCITHPLWEDMEEHIKAYLLDVTLASVIEKNKRAA
jgi:Rrf2 family iron-sulfur cluster assembly transcriptional regulator